MTRDEALQKIKKCLALAASPEAHEAAAAMRQAQKLMEQFGLSAEDVSLADVEEKGAKAHNVTLQNWEAMLPAPSTTRACLAEVPPSRLDWIYEKL